MSEATAKYLTQHTCELKRRLLHNDVFIQACKNLGIEKVDVLLPLKRSDDEELTREKLLEIKNHDSWRQGILEAVISEQMRLRELDENYDTDGHFDLEESRRIDEEYRERNRVFEENMEKRWKEVSRKHLKQRTRDRFPGRQSYRKFKQRERERPYHQTFLTKEMRTKKLRENAREREERSKHKKEWREWEEMQTRWKRTAQIQYKNARLDSFLADKGRQLMMRREEILRGEHDSRISPELLARREKERVEMKKRITSKHAEASKRREDITLRRDMEMAVRGNLFDQRRDNAIRYLRAKEWEKSRRRR